MIYLFTGFLIELLWDLLGNFVFAIVPENFVVFVTLVIDLLILGLFLLGAMALRQESKHFQSAFVISIILISTSCLTTVLNLFPDMVSYDGLTAVVPLVLGLMLTYQLIKGIIDRHHESQLIKSAQRLMTYWKASLWLLGGLFVTLVVGMIAILGTVSYQYNGQSIESDWLLNMGEDFFALLANDVLPVIGPFLIGVAVVLVGLILAYLIVRILFVVTVYQLKDVQGPVVAEAPQPAVK